MKSTTRALATFAAFLSLGVVSFCRAENEGHAAKVLRVEEDWEMQVGEPNESRSAPQATMVMSPSGSHNGLYFILTINHRSEPSYAAGGLQVQVWQGDACVSHKNGPQYNALDKNDDLVRWTQRMTLVDGQISFEVVGGASQSWGTFGGEGYLRDTATASLDNLNAYRPQMSTDESGIGFAGNRVGSLKLLRIRWYLDDGKYYELSGEADVDTDLDPWTMCEAISHDWSVDDL